MDIFGWSPGWSPGSNAEKTLTLRAAGAAAVRQLIATLAVLSCLILSTEMLAETLSPQSLSDLVHDYLDALSQDNLSPDQRQSIEVAYIDPRLRLPDCSRQLDLSLNGNQRVRGKVQVRVQCNGSAPWSKFVGAEIKVYQPILVAATNLPRGTTLQEEHLLLVETDVASLRRPPLTDISAVLGNELKYSLTADRPLHQEMIQLPKVVKRGDLVQLVAQTESLQVRQQAEALEDGEIGKTINVRNTSSELVVQATVVGAGRVKIEL